MEANSQILIFGAGGHASKIVNIARSNGRKIIGYISTEDTGTIIDGISVKGDLQYYKNTPELHSYKIHIALGENSVRYKIYESIGVLRKNLTEIISDKSVISGNVSIGRGTCILDSVVIQPRVRLGKCSILDTGAIVEHDCEVGDFVNVSPGAILCGWVKVNNGGVIGAGAVVIEKVTIGTNSLIGAGSVVTQDIGDNCVAVGSPARVIKQRNFGDMYLKQ